MDYSKVLKNSWQTIWKHKVIIWFGFMMAIPSIIMGLIMGGFFFFFNEENFPFFFNPYASEPDINLIFIILLATRQFHKYLQREMRIGNSLTRRLSVKRKPI
jgi:hypothetical protein